jgi:selenocysteine lyase/cysteine desulfurase
MPALDVRAARALFPVFEDTAYLDTATFAPGSQPARQAVETALAAWLDGSFDWVAAEKAGEDARRSFAALIGADEDEVSLNNAASTGAGVIAAQLPRAGQGENVVVGATEFTSNFLPWAGLSRSGYEVRHVPGRDGGFRPEDFEARCDGGTRLIAVSAVQSASGYRVDLRALAAIARRSAAWLVVDASQAAGAVPLDVRRDGIDALFAANHKFLLGARGLGYLFLRREHLEGAIPITPGWRAGREPMESFYGPAVQLSGTASRLDMSLAWFNALADRESFRLMESVGHERIHERNARLTEALAEALEARGFSLPFSGSERSTIVSIPVEDPEATRSRLAAAGVVAALRGGRLRLSVHFYNDESDLERAMRKLC